jgi:hypothetical protein
MQNILLKSIKTARIKLNKSEDIYFYSNNVFSILEEIYRKNLKINFIVTVFVIFLSAHVFSGKELSERSRSNSNTKKEAKNEKCSNLRETNDVDLKKVLKLFQIFLNLIFSLS